GALTPPVVRRTKDRPGPRPRGECLRGPRVRARGWTPGDDRVRGPGGGRDRGRREPAANAGRAPRSLREPDLGPAPAAARGERTGGARGAGRGAVRKLRSPSSSRAAGDRPRGQRGDRGGPRQP